MRKISRMILFALLWLAAIGGLTYAYLYPGSEALFEQRTDTVMSDDTDGATLTFAYDALIRTFHAHPERFFYGTVYAEGLNPERGIAMWMSWNERWLVVAASYFFPLEQLSTAMVFALLMLNALAMYLLGRFLRWNWSISLGLAIGWAFCAFTRARAKVHMSMAGTYHLPLIFLGLFLVARGKGWRSMVAAALAFLLAMTVIHYFIVTTLFLSPLFLLFIAMQPEFRANWKRVSLRLIVAILPALCFLAFNFKFPVPADAKMSREESFPTGGEFEEGKTHPFLLMFAARPLDYLGGDISLQYESKDPNPLREQINAHILETLGNGNPHERTNGIRWLVIILSIGTLVYLLRGRFKDDRARQLNIGFFFLFATVTFWLSLSPDFPFPGWGLSNLLHSLVSQVRVPSRAGINVHFALLMITGFFLSSQIRWRRWLQMPGVFPLLMIVGYPPLVQNIPMAPLRPVYKELQRSEGSCGAGFYFPYINFYHQTQQLYWFVQQMRGSDCGILNQFQTPKRLLYMAQKFPARPEYLQQLNTDTQVREQTERELERLARCIPLTWLVFDPATPLSWREQMCRRLGWTLNPDLTCIAPDKGAPLQRLPDACG